MYNLQTRARAQRARKGFVSVYAITKSRQIVFSHHEAVEASQDSGKLFAVLVLKWDGLFHGPLGVVLGILEQGMNRFHADHSFFQGIAIEVGWAVPRTTGCGARDTGTRYEYVSCRSFLFPRHSHHYISLILTVVSMEQTGNCPWIFCWSHAFLSCAFESSWLAENNHCKSFD